MPLDRTVLDEHVAKLNAKRRPDQHIRVEHHEPPGKFTLSFPDRAMPEGQCIDQDFSDIQWSLHDGVSIDAGIQGGRLDEEAKRYFIEYEVIEWD